CSLHPFPTRRSSDLNPVVDAGMPANCGGSGQQCCAGNPRCAGANLVCDQANNCIGCGGDGQQCCAGNTCGGGECCLSGRCRAARSEEHTSELQSRFD